ncbi:protein of unassigned function [Methylobacterium oryzae CBMB20]|uniref:Protein of unassigned function n=1 Tax=Methylobacterium oryzae CBMB20 TaxID=693986 RepID=A0A089NUJ7_9HYPH|nr:protein of unassigned function [Methylobacterium oryzae CBMB20]
MRLTLGDTGDVRPGATAQVFVKNLRRRPPGCLVRHADQMQAGAILRAAARSTTRRRR